MEFILRQISLKFLLSRCKYVKFRPKNKFIRITKDENFSSDMHYLSNTPAMAKASCSYDLDPVDEAWLNILNGERTMAGHLAVTEEQFERVIEELEVFNVQFTLNASRNKKIFDIICIIYFAIIDRLYVGIKFRLSSKLKKGWALNMMKM